MDRKHIALVLGGGGAAGNAWLIGIVAGLAEAGLDLTERADLVIGTSAGANAAVQVRSGIPPAALLAAVLTPPPLTAGGGGGRPAQAAPQMEPVFERMRTISAAATSVEELMQAMSAYGRESDANFAADYNDKRRVMIGARLPRTDWPERDMIIVAINADTAQVALFDRHAGVSLVDAAAAAVALPGAGPTHSIDGTRYISGGIRSNENADLAADYANIIVLSPLAGRTGPLPPGQFEGLRRPPGADLPGQVAALRQAGRNVIAITPDAESRAAMGINQMDPATRMPSARAGFAQGRREAAGIVLR